MEDERTTDVFYQDTFSLVVHLITLESIDFPGRSINEPIELGVGPVMPPRSYRLRMPHHTKQVVGIREIVLEGNQAQ